jgi:RNA polymerase sigma-70 factor (ECF subfamily)
MAVGYPREAEVRLSDSIINMGVAGEVLPMREASLVEACQRGERQALEALYRLHSRRVYSVVRRMVGAMDADEVTQETFIRIFRGINGFRGESGLGTWVYRLAVNVSLTFLSRRQQQLERMRPVEAGDDLAGAPPRAATTLERVQLERAMAQLPPGYRAVLVLHDVEGLSHEEIGEVLGWQRGTSKSQLHKARARMRELLLGPEATR